MAEVPRSSFDLNSSQGLTDLLQYARKSTMDPRTYSAFRDLVLQHAQQKGTNPELKKKIEAALETLTFRNEKPEVVVTEPPQSEPEKSVVTETISTRPPITSGHGRRTVPSFASTYTATTPTPKIEALQEKIEVPVSAPEPVIETVPPPAPMPSAPVPPPPPPEPTPEVKPVIEVPAEAPLKSIEEYKARITEIKHRVNALVGNPATLMDHGNQLGREYMGVLLTALKATSPGSTTNVEVAMQNLEAAFAKILAHGNGEGSDDPVPPTIPEAVQEDISTPTLEPAPESPEEVQEEVAPAEESVPEPVVVEEVVVSQSPEVEETREEESVDMKAQIQKLRASLIEKETEIQSPSQPQTSHRVLPSILDIEETEINTEPGLAPASSLVERRSIDELSTAALTRRPGSALTGITMGTPQADLALPEVTNVLNQLLHDWNIFASSGLFGMGPSGIEHPLYEKLSVLPMGEVLSGRFENANMKIVHIIKDYVDAWRHEQGIAYNPTETFDHYLRRVSQRIMKRQSGSKAV